MSINTKAIDHVLLWVRSVSESKKYYEKVFGFTCTLRADNESTLVVESDNVHFFMSEFEKENEFISKQHISFEVDSLKEVISNLKYMDISDFDVGEINIFQNRNYKWCEWRDPNGIRLECVEVL